MTKNQFKKRFMQLQKQIAKDRDDLRDLIAQAEDILDTTESAVGAMEEAAEYLSELL